MLILYYLWLKIFSMKQSQKDEKPKCNSEILCIIYRKNYTKQLILEDLFYRRCKNGKEKFLNSNDIWKNILPFYTSDLMYNSSRDLSDICLQELYNLNLLEMTKNENEFFFAITESGIDALKSFSIQNLAASTFSNYTLYLQAYWTKILAVLALLVSILALILTLISKSC